MHPIVSQLIAVLVATGLSAAVAAGAWYWALRGASQLRHHARLTERKRVLYLDVVRIVAEMMADAKNPKSKKALKSRPEEILLGRLTSPEFRLKQIELNVIAPEDVVRQLSWHAIPNNLDELQQGQQALRNIGSLLLAIRRDLTGPTNLDEVDMWRIFLDADGADILSSQFAKLDKP